MGHKRSGEHPQECRDQLRTAMRDPSVRSDRQAMSRAMKGYHACRVRLGVIKPKGR